MIGLGDTAKDQITGYKGVVVCVQDWINGCRRLGIQPEGLTKDGQPSEIHVFDDSQLILIKKAAKPVATLKAKIGGPCPPTFQRMLR